MRLSRGQVDNSKIGLGGWSNGAILTMALITRRHYQAASAGAGGSEWSADWGVCDFGMSFSNYYLGKAPFEDPEALSQERPVLRFPQGAYADDPLSRRSGFRRAEPS